MKRRVIDTDLKAGDILVAEPFVPEELKHNVILLLNKDNNGFYGLIINKPVEDLMISECLDIFSGLESRLYFGGPVEEESIYCLVGHSEKFDENSIEVLPNLYLISDFNKLVFFIDTKQITPDQVRFYAGCCTWPHSMMKFEIYKNFWYIPEIDPKTYSKIVLSKNADFLWQEITQKRSESHYVITNISRDFSKN